MKITFVEASAGSGKTTFLLQQITKLDITPPALFLAFSNAAVNEMKMRLERHNKDTLSNVEICTLHSLANEIVRSKFKDMQIHKSLQYSSQYSSQWSSQWSSNVSPLDEIRNLVIFQLMHNKDFAELFKWLINSNSTINYNAPNHPKPKLEKAKHPEIITPSFEKHAKILEDAALIDKSTLESIASNFFTKTWSIRQRIASFHETEIAWAINRILEHKQYITDYSKWVSSKVASIINTNVEQYKKTNSLCDFNDLIIFASIILEQSDEIFFNKFGHIKLILLDESQDLSAEQWELFYIIASKFRGINCEIIIAGDPKQLIYTFQGASVEIFYKYKTKLIAIADDFEEKELNYTYRLSKEVCRYTNELFLNKLQINFPYKEHCTMNEARGSVEIAEIDKLEDIIPIIILHNLQNPESKIMIIFRQKTSNIKNLAHALFARGVFLNSPYFIYHPIMQDFICLLKFIFYNDELSFHIASERASSQFIRELQLLYKQNMDLFMLCLQWIDAQAKTSVHNNFLIEKLGDLLPVWQYILLNYCKFYKNDILAAMNDSEDFYKNHNDKMIQKLFANGVFFNTVHASKGNEADLVILLDTDASSMFNNENYNLLYVGVTRTKNRLYIPIIKKTIQIKSKTWAAKIMKTYEDFAESSII